jgi:H+/Cl- antiporter ClcA
MTRSFKCLRFTLAVVLGSGCLVLDDNPFVRTASLISDAQARIGRPLTPMSYAGVARRTTRRAVAAGAAVGAAAAYSSSCYQTVDAYGRVYTRCP